MKVSHEIYLLLQTKCQCNAETDGVGSNAAAEQTVTDRVLLSSQIWTYTTEHFSFVFLKDDAALSEIILFALII